MNPPYDLVLAGIVGVGFFAALAWIVIPRKPPDE